MPLIEKSREPLRKVVATQDALADCLAALRHGQGPVAFDTERAHGYRYWPKAYLLQIRRAGSGTWLIDPTAFEQNGSADLSCLIEACASATWIIHAAGQDLPCMRDLNIRPARIFDSELSARLLGKPGASLGALLEAELGITLRKAHSAANWSRRPLPEPWLTYAALDVDYLVELASVLADQLVAAQRHPWAQQEFEDALAKGLAEPVAKVDPWRRLSGITTLRTPLQFAVARQLWLARDAIAQQGDKPPTRIISDAAIVQAANFSRTELPQPSDLTAIYPFAKSRYRNSFVAALEELHELDPAQFPPPRLASETIPHPKNWARTNPAAAKRWQAVRPAIDELACDLGGLQPSLVAPPHALQTAIYDYELPESSQLLALGMRPWQVDFLTPLLQETLAS